MTRVGEWIRDGAGRAMPAVYVLGVVGAGLMMFFGMWSYSRGEIGVVDVTVYFFGSFNLVWAQLLLFVKAQAEGRDELFPLLPDSLLVSPVLTAYGVTGFVCVQATSFAWILR